MSSELTPYQESLLARKPVSWKRWAWRMGNLTFIAVLAAGYLAEVMGDLPSYLAGWLDFGTGFYILRNWFALPCMAIVWVVLAILGKMLRAANDPNDAFHTEAMELKETDKPRYILLKIMSGTGFYHVYSVAWYAITDIILDWALFALLVTANHVVFAFFHMVALLGQYWLYSCVRKVAHQNVALLNDPLEAKEKVNIDDLMDQLIEPVDPKDKKPYGTV